MTLRSSKSESAYKTISEVSQLLEVPAHVLRFWETKFTQLKPMKRSGGRRYYKPDDIALLERIRALLYQDGFTIKGAQKALKTSKPAADDIEQPLSVATDDLGRSASNATSVAPSSEEGGDQMEDVQPSASASDIEGVPTSQAPTHPPHAREALRLLKEAEAALSQLAARL